MSRKKYVEHPDSTIEDLDNLITDLQKYCHSVDCEDWEMCPEMHPGCFPKLGLDTAIAWTIAEYMNHIKWLYLERDQIFTKDIYGEYYYKLSTLNKLVSYRKEQSKYVILDSLIKRARAMLVSISEYLNIYPCSTRVYFN